MEEDFKFVDTFYAVSVKLKDYFKTLSAHPKNDGKALLVLHIGSAKSFLALPGTVILQSRSHLLTYIDKDNRFQKPKV